MKADEKKKMLQNGLTTYYRFEDQYKFSAVEWEKYHKLWRTVQAREETIITQYEKAIILNAWKFSKKNIKKAKLRNVKIGRDGTLTFRSTYWVNRKM